MQIQYRNFGVGMSTAMNVSLTAKKQTHSNTAGNSAAQCKVTISGEGKKRSDETKQQSAQALKADELVLRQQKQDTDYKTEYANALDEIRGLWKSVYSGNATEETLETLQKKQQALRNMADQKDRQDAENEQKIAEAMGALAGISKEQQEVDENSRDLLVLLKSLEESEKDEEEGTGGTHSESSHDKGQTSIGDELWQSADTLGASAAVREMAALGAIEGLKSEGLAYLDRMDGMRNESRQQLKQVGEIMQDDSLSEEEKAKLVTEGVAAARASAAESVNEIHKQHLRGKGMQMIRDAKELSVLHQTVRAYQPLDGVAKAQETIREAAVDAAWGEASGELLERTSEELADEIQAELEKRNDIGDTGEDEAIREEERLDEEAELAEEERELEQQEEQARLESETSRQERILAGEEPVVQPEGESAK